MLRRQGVDLKTAQELLRHANTRFSGYLLDLLGGAERDRTADLLVAK
jgi:hypothetical protein